MFYSILTRPMKVYKNILVATKCKKDFESQVGVFLINASMQLIGEAELSKKGRNLYADFKVEIDIDEYYPDVKFINTIDSIILNKSRSTPFIDSIKKQLS